MTKDDSTAEDEEALGMATVFKSGPGQNKNYTIIDVKDINLI